MNTAPDTHDGVPKLGPALNWADAALTRVLVPMLMR
jgi:hypothetical protein